MHPGRTPRAPRTSWAPRLGWRPPGGTVLARSRRSQACRPWAARRRAICGEPLAREQRIHPPEVPVEDLDGSGGWLTGAGGDRVPGVPCSRGRPRGPTPTGRFTAPRRWPAADRATSRAASCAVDVDDAVAGLFLAAGGPGPDRREEALHRRQPQRHLPRVLRGGDADRRGATPTGRLLPNAAALAGARGWPSAGPSTAAAAGHHLQGGALRAGHRLVRRREGAPRALGMPRTPPSTRPSPKCWFRATGRNDPAQRRRIFSRRSDRRRGKNRAHPRATWRRRAPGSPMPQLGISYRAARRRRRGRDRGPPRHAGRDSRPGGPGISSSAPTARRCSISALDYRYAVFC